MFYLKNDDMEELFRKAAENFEVDTGKASNWEAINNALHNNGDDNNDNKKKKKRRFIFWWFLLFPAGWIAHNTWDKMGNPGNTTYKKYAAPVQYQPVDKKDNNQYSIPPTATSVNEKETVSNDDVPAEVVSDASRHKAKLNANMPGIGSIKVTAEQKPFKPAQTAASKNTKLAFYQKERTVVTKQPVQQKKIFEENNTSAGNKNSNDVTYAEDDIVVSSSLQSLYPGFAWSLPPVTGNGPLKETIVKKTNVVPGNDSTIREKKKEAAKDKTHYFYVEALAAPDLTTVKFQHFSGTGSSIGLLFGYRFNKRFHIEGGAFLEKNYIIPVVNISTKVNCLITTEQ